MLGARRGEGTLNRRRFYIAATYALWAVIGMVMAVSGLIYLLFPPKSQKRRRMDGRSRTSASRLPLWAREEVLFPRSRVDGWKVTVEKTKAWMVRKPDGKVVAFGPQSTHLGCALSLGREGWQLFVSLPLVAFFH